jgi:hypothetical protein
MQRRAFACLGLSGMKLRRCKYCKEPFEKRSMAHIACSPTCALQLALVAREKKFKADYKARKEAVKTRSDWMKEAQVAFNAFIRERDRQAGVVCISSGKPLDWSGNNVDAGHYRSTGSSPHLRFDERNCHAQSKHDNRYLSGNAVDYRIGLIARIGLQAVEAIEADQEPRKWSIDELKAIKAHYRAKLKQLKEASNEQA